MKKYLLFTIICLLLTACQGQVSAIYDAASAVSVSTPVADQGTSTKHLANQVSGGPTSVPQMAPTTAPQGPAGLPTAVPVKPGVTPNPASVPTQAPQPNPSGKLPAFDHIVLMILENQSYGAVIGNPQMPNLNALAKKYVTLTNYFAVSHPSLPNYIAIMSGDTQNITSDCTNCFVNAPSLADLLDAGGKTWKAYEEDMPSPCFIGDNKLYAQKHDPLLYFDSVRLNSARCERSIVPLTQLDSDLAANQLPNFSFIMPNLCNSGHDCGQDISDTWIGNMVNKLNASPAFGKNSLIVIVYDEAAKSDRTSCCNMGSKAGGQVAAVLISPDAKAGFADNNAYDHYSVLKTILTAWNLPGLGKTNDPATLPILGPFQQ